LSTTSAAGRLPVSVFAIDVNSSGSWGVAAARPA
jgi:hypothetical protein